MPAIIFVAIALLILGPRVYDRWLQPPPAALSFGAAPFYRGCTATYAIGLLGQEPTGSLTARIVREGDLVRCAVEGQWTVAAMEGPPAGAAAGPAGATYARAGSYSVKGSFTWKAATMELVEAKLDQEGPGLRDYDLATPGDSAALLPFEWAFRLSALKIPVPSSDLFVPSISGDGELFDARMTHIGKLSFLAAAGKYHCDKIDLYRDEAYFRSAYIDIESPYLPVAFFDAGMEARLLKGAEFPGEK